MLKRLKNASYQYVVLYAGIDLAIKDQEKYWHKFSTRNREGTLTVALNGLVMRYFVA